MVCSDDSKAMEDSECLTPYCCGKALPALDCGHRFCSRCMVGVVKFSCPQFPLLVLKCPLCRAKQGFCKWSFYMLFRLHYPKGAMLLECDAPCEGFCLATWELIDGPPDQKPAKAEKVGRARRARRRQADPEEDTACYMLTYLPAVNDIHLLDGDATSSGGEEPFQLRRLFDVMAQRVQCLESAKQLLKESTGINPSVCVLDF